LSYEASILPLALAPIPVALAARFASTIVPVTLPRRHYDFVRGTVIVLVWGGLRGGISIALAVSLPETPLKAALLAATYAVVISTIVVQGLTLGKVATRALRTSNSSR
jgi:CPA1 family monovalent cation:H+ antiporter